MDYYPTHKYMHFKPSYQTSLMGRHEITQKYKNFHISKHLVSLPRNFKNITTKVEPPSPILELKVSADQMSDDPLSNSVFMIMGYSSDQRSGAFCRAFN
jgi:hypothetical protein